LKSDKIASENKNRDLSEQLNKLKKFKNDCKCSSLQVELDKVKNECKCDSLRTELEKVKNDCNKMNQNSTLQIQDFSTKKEGTQRSPNCFFQEG
jgi:hypothetical protein